MDHIQQSTTYDSVYFFNIKVYNIKDSSQIVFLSWSGLVFELRMKYDWYFKYRAALLQVQYPRYNVVTAWGAEPAKGKTLAKIQEDKAKAKKAKITEYENKLQKAKDTWSSLFPIEEDIYFIKALQKINKLKFELQSIQQPQ